MSSIDQQFVEFIVKSLVSNPDAVTIDRRIDEKGVLLELTVDPEDLGRVIGKRGATAQSLRTLLRALGTKNEARYNLKIIDNGTGSNDSGSTNDNRAARDDDSTSGPVSNDSSRIEETKSQAEPVTTKELPPEPANDRVSQTRRELAELDDLDL